jgi:beta-phosphoglucomutase-like phosphatase (HAD superfamily)
VLGLPDGIRGCQFVLDGVLTKAAKARDGAWKEMFDGYLRGRARQSGQPFVPFDPVADCGEYAGGTPGAEGTRSFRKSRRIELLDGREDDPPGAQTVYGLGSPKNAIVLGRIRANGMQACEGPAGYVRAARDAGSRRAVVSSSANRDVLAAAGIEDLFEARIDGMVAVRRHLPGKPVPDPFLAGAPLGLDPAATAVSGDAVAGLASGRAGGFGFGFVVGVDRAGQAEALNEQGADFVVAGLAKLVDRR